MEEQFERREMLWRTGAIIATGLAGLSFVLSNVFSDPTEETLKSAEPRVRVYSVEDYVKALVQIESSGNPRAKNWEPNIKEHSYGLGQLTETKARELEKNHPELPRLGWSHNQMVASLFNPQINRAYTTANFTDEYSYYGNPFVAVSAHNAGHFTPRHARSQSQLNDVQGSALNPDGLIGPKSKVVVRQFQRNHSLKPDGKIGRMTHGKLQEVWTYNFPGKENPMGIVPRNRSTPHYVEKFREALSKI
jgi:hypothetical protein